MGAGTDRFKLLCGLGRCPVYASSQRTPFMAREKRLMASLLTWVSCLPAHTNVGGRRDGSVIVCIRVIGQTLSITA